MKHVYRSAAVLLWSTLAATSAAAAPGDVNADTFYANAVALQKKGMGAVFDGRLKPMIAQMKDAGTRTRAINETAAKSGKPLYCVPETTKKKGMGSDKVVQLLGSLPQPERRSLTLAEAWKRIMVREYPCS